MGPMSLINTNGKIEKFATNETHQVENYDNQPTCESTLNM